MFCCVFGNSLPELFSYYMIRFTKASKKYKPFYGYNCYVNAAYSQWNKAGMR